MSDTEHHWDRVYATKSDSEVSWFQARTATSLELIRVAAPTHSTPIIDVGSGASRLLDGLIAEGFTDIAALDISATALQHARDRLGPVADAVQWIVADITQWQPARTWGVWHDRAVFHFLTERVSQDAYIAAMSKALPAGATAIIATFALDGPERCSGLPVQRYSATTLAERLGPGFRLVSETPENHATPRGGEQRFIYAVLGRT
jgi:SAM-dependent methyltransferase